VPIRRATFFPPDLDPVLDRGVRDEHAVIAPEAPTSRAIRQAVLNDKADSGIDDASGVVTAGRRQVGHVGIEVLATAGAIVLGVDDDGLAGPSGEGIAEVVETATELAVAIGAMTAAWAGPASVIPALAADLGFGQILDAGYALGGVGSVFTGSWHDLSPGRSLPGDTHATTDLFTDPAR
jgi:hypothetical protein